MGKLRDMDRLNLDNYLTFGIEIEVDKINIVELGLLVEGFNLIKNGDYNWCGKWEPTVLTGGEIVSPVLKDSISTLEDIQLLCSLLKERKMKPSELCALHVHFNADYFEKDNNGWLGLLELFLTYEPIIYRYGHNKQLKVRKHILDYVRPLNYNKDDYYSFVDFFRNHNIDMFTARKVFFDNYEEIMVDPVVLNKLVHKMRSINFSNVIYNEDLLSNAEIEIRKRKPTIEFRVADSTYEEAEINAIILFYGRMMEKAKNGQIDIDNMREEHMIYEYNGLSYQEFSKIPKKNMEVAEKLFSFLAEDTKEEKILMKQYLKSND